MLKACTPACMWYQALPSENFLWQSTLFLRYKKALVMKTMISCITLELILKLLPNIFSGYSNPYIIKIEKQPILSYILSGWYINLIGLRNTSLERIKWGEELPWMWAAHLGRDQKRDEGESKLSSSIHLFLLHDCPVGYNWLPHTPVFMVSLSQQYLICWVKRNPSSFELV